MLVNGESKQRREWPAIVKSNLKSILAFVKHSSKHETFSGANFKVLHYEEEVIPLMLSSPSGS